MSKYSNVAIVVHTNKTGGETIAALLQNNLKQFNIHSKIFDVKSMSNDILEGFDLCITIGGDGTILNVISSVVRGNIPILPINNGSLGFLTSCYDQNDIKKIDNVIFAENLFIKKSLIEIEFSDGQRFLALNDVWFRNKIQSRIVRLGVSCNGNYVNNFNADGIIFCSQTGSTAYNLSAGGPIAADDIECIILTPILSHSLNNRSIIFGKNSELQIKNNNQNSTIVMHYDNANCVQLNNNTVKLKLSCEKITFIYDKNHNFYSTIQKKLKW